MKILIKMDAEQLKALMAHQMEMFNKMMEGMQLQNAQQLQGAQGQRPSASNVHVPQPSPLALEGDMEENMDFFEKSWKDYAKAIGMDRWPQDENAQKVSFLLSVIGEPAKKKYFNFELTAAESVDPDTALAAIRDKVVAKRNIIVDRLDFFSATQQARESIDDFVSRLKTLAKMAKLGALQTELIAFKVVTSNKWPSLRSKMLTVTDITLPKAVDMCRAEEITAKRCQELSLPNPEVDVNKVKGKSRYQAQAKKCKFCGDYHDFSKGSCPAFGKKCHRCKGRNHFEKVCKVNRYKNKKSRKVKEIKDESSDSEDPTSSSNEASSEASEDEYEIGKIIDNSEKGGSVLAELQLKFSNKWKSVMCELDTGANTSLIGLDWLIKLTGKENPQLLPSTYRLQSFGGHPIKVLGEVKIPCRRKKQRFRLVLQVVDVNHCPILSSKASRVLGFIKFCKSVKFGKSHAKEPVDSLSVYRIAAEKIIEEHKEIFTGYGKFEGEVSLEVDSSVPPSIQSPRRVPIAMRNKLKKELELLEKEGMIVKEVSHTEWVSNLVIVQRGDPESASIRICLDPIPLNKALKRPNLQFSTLDEILPELGKAKIFSTVDVKKGFWHVKLDEPSSRLTTFWTPFGRYRWTRLPFGISSAPEIFQMKLQEVIQGLEGVECLADDILVFGVGETLEEALQNHNRCLNNLLNRLNSKNVKLNKSKLKLCQTSVKFFGHVLSSEGLQPDESKIATIQNFPTPLNRKEVHRFIGMVTYLSKFIRNLSINLTNLRKLISETVPWRWTNIENEEFKRVKELVANVKTLQYYNPKEPLTMECDASCFGLGVAVYQEEGVIGYASRTLTATERNYAQIEKELLAILFACVRFDQLVVGNPKTIVKTDHKPLINIFEKPLLSAPKRLQHMLLNLQRYNLVIEFVTGKDNVVADALSRAPFDDKAINDEYSKLQVYKVFEQVEGMKLTKFLNISGNCLNEIMDETTKDSTMQSVIQFIQQGWPRSADRVPDGVRAYFGFRDELSVQDGMVFRKDRILIPHNLRKRLIEKCHVSHNGSEATLKLARANLFWPGMSSQIKDTVKSCPTCAKFASSQPDPPMMSHRIPVHPFQFVSMDVFFSEFRGRNQKFLVTVDHYSDFFEVDILKDLTPESVIAACSRNFSRHGIPQTLLTDNGTNFINQKMRNFTLEWDIDHITSAPHHQQANGKSEAAVKIAKRLLKKAEETGTDFWYALLHWRNIPNKIGSSPVARLFSRSTRNGIPTSGANLLPKVVEHVPAAIEENRRKIKLNYDRKSRNLPELQIGSPVYVQMNPEVKEGKQWTPGTIANRLSERSYTVNVSGNNYRRSLVHLKPRKDPVLPPKNPVENISGPVTVPMENENNNSPGDSSASSCPTTSSSQRVLSQQQHEPPTQTVMPVPASPIATPPICESPKTSRAAASGGRPKRVTRIPEKLKDYVVEYE